MLSTTIPARAVEARAQRADTTPEIDRSGCRGTGKHGTNGAARTRGCTCPDAIAARQRYDRARYLARRPNGRQLAVGTHRRLRALVALGATPASIAAATGIAERTARRLLRDEPGHHYVHAPVALAVRDLFTRVIAQLDNPAASLERAAQPPRLVAARDQRQHGRVQPARRTDTPTARNPTLTGQAEHPRRTA